MDKDENQRQLKKIDKLRLQHSYRLQFNIGRTKF